MKYRLLILVGLFTIVESYSQVTSMTSSFTSIRKVSDVAIEAIQIGDYLPDIPLNNLINYSNSTANTHDFRGKLLIFDFWATWCSPCVAAFPKIDSIQKIYKNKLQIISVTSEENNKVTPFLSKLNQLKSLSPVIISDDKLLNKYFLHHTLPHYVWINKNGKIVGFTDGSELTFNNIEKVLKDSNYIVKSKTEVQDYVINDYLNDKTVFSTAVNLKKNDDTIYSEIELPNIKYRSNLTGYLDNILGGGTNVSFTSFFLYNASTLNLYKAVLWKHGQEMLSESTIIVEIKDSILYNKIVPNKSLSGVQYMTWLKEGNGYCYEITVDSSLSALKFDIALDELNKIFGLMYGIKGSLKEREIEYLALKRLPQSEIPITKGGNRDENQTAFSIRLTNMPVTYLIYALRKPLQFYPFLEDETGIMEKIDINITCNLSNLTELNEQLKKFGLHITKEKKVKLMAVIETLK